MGEHMSEQITALNAVLSSCTIEESGSTVLIVINDSEGHYESSIVFTLAVPNTDGAAVEEGEDVQIEYAEIQSAVLSCAVCDTLTQSLMEAVKSEPADLIAAAVFAHGQLLDAYARERAAKPTEVASCAKIVSKEAKSADTSSREQHPQLSAANLASMCILKSEPIKVKKSLFVAHTAHVQTVADVDRLCTYLKTVQGFGNATHNIVAYRLCPYGDSSALEEGFDDDGEHAAGGRLLLLMQKMKVYNRVAFVSRYFGGVLLGPVRFKYINDCAQQVMLLAKEKDPKFSTGI